MTWSVSVLLALVVLVALSAMGYSDDTLNVSGAPAPVTDGLLVTVVPTAIDPAADQITANLSVEPLGSYADESGDPSQDVTLVVNADSGESSFLFVKGKSMPVPEVKLFSDGNYSRYPMDRYEAEIDLYATMKTDEGEEDVDVAQDADTAIENWVVDVTLPTNAGASTDSTATMTLSRPVLSRIWVGVCLALIIIIGLVAGLVSVQLLGRMRPVESSLLGWGAALIFAVITLRTGILPGAPPVGAWIDILAFFPAMVMVIVTYLVVVQAWLRKKPDWGK